MNFEEFAADLPPERTRWFTSPEALEEALHGYGVYQPTLQADAGQFRAGLAERSSEHCELFADRYSTSLSLHLQTPPDAVGVLIPRSVNGRFLASGVDLNNEHLLVFSDGATTDIVGPGPIGSDDMAIPEARFFEMLEVLCPGASLPNKLTMIEVEASHLLEIGQELVSLIGAPEIELQGEPLSNLLEQTVSLIGHASTQFQSAYRGDKQNLSRAAKAVQEFIHENYHEHIRLEALCRATGLGIRTLQRSFRNYFDMSIMDYLKTLRLDAVRRELLGSHSSTDTVTEIAVRHGFKHLGRFSLEFRSRFGMSPSEVLEIRPDQE